MSMFDDGGETHDVTMRSKKKQHSSQDDVGGVSKSAKETEEPGVAVKQITRPRDELDSIFTRKTNSGIRTTVSAPECKKKTVAHETKHGQHGWEADVNAERLKRRMERKRFMASKSEKILSASSTASLGISRRDDQVMSASKARKVEREQLQAMAKEIQSFGTWCFMIYPGMHAWMTDVYRRQEYDNQYSLARMVEFFHCHLQPVIRI